MIYLGNGIYRGPRPKSFQQLKDRGITLSINLQSGFHEELNDDEYEFEYGPDFGVTEVNVNLSDFKAPHPRKVNLIMRLLDEHQGKGNVYIHCRHGKDRTGFICAVYRMATMQWTYREAKNEMFNLGFHKIPYLIWLPELSKYEHR